MKIVDRIKEKSKELGSKIADFQSKGARLSNEQLSLIDEERRNLWKESNCLEEKTLQEIGVAAFQLHLAHLGNLYSAVSTDELQDPNDLIGYYDITRWVVEKEERDVDRLVNVFQAFAGEMISLALIFNRTTDNVSVHFAIRNLNPERQQPDCLENELLPRLKGVMKGNFPGTEDLNKSKQGLVAELQSYGENSYVAVVTNQPSEKSDRYASQTIEKLLDGLIPEGNNSYTLVLLAQPALNVDEEQRLLFQYYDRLSPYATWQSGVQSSEAFTEGASLSLGGSISANWGKHKTESVGISAGPANAGVSKGSSFGISGGVNLARTALSHRTVSGGSTETRTYTDHSVQHALNMLEQQIKRIDLGKGVGMWSFAAYVISDDYSLASNAANTYLALTQGEQSFLNPSVISQWREDEAKKILKWIQKLEHPQFVLNLDNDEEYWSFPLLTTATLLLTGRELTYGMNFPRRSVTGLPVYSTTSFGREVLPRSEKDAATIDLGFIYHMRSKENTGVQLDKNKLAAHTFITGSTGSGKTNTVCHLLGKLCLEDPNSDARFLVIEPAKGEYKTAFKSQADIYGTDPRNARLLRLNPFSFSEKIHVTAHLERLVEIFNACWPMYAAMPAILKNAISKAYESCGWDLTYSVCRGPKRYPDFSLVIDKIREIMDSSEFSKDTLGDYKGALMTRLKSLTDGVNGLVLCSDERALGDRELFDENTIVDLSDVGFMDTRSLLMGILVLKLHEYRKAQGGNNQNLRHVTVLEEAHHLLRRTTTVQTQESSNLQGKSVEMLANAIAEMRTYGEGFIIADQAPGLLDEAVIRNTNTKIILRLPDEADRQLVGKAASLNEEQIKELARLERGVAAVYQNEWLEPVLCMVEEFTPTVQADGNGSSVNAPVIGNEEIWGLLLDGGRIDREPMSEEKADQIRRWIDKSGLWPPEKADLKEVLLKNKQISPDERRELLYRAVQSKKLLYDMLMNHAAPEDLSVRLMEQLRVSDELARRIQTEICLYAAEHITNLETERRLRELGGGTVV